MLSPETKDTGNPKDRIGDTKPRLCLVPPALEIFVAKVMEHGAEKYGAFNWRETKVRRTVYLEAAKRHLSAALDGEDVDPESGVPHEAHAAACMGIILDAMSMDAMIDDRPVKGPAAGLIARFSKAR
jgi:hypothetical protein